MTVVEPRIRAEAVPTTTRLPERPRGHSRGWWGMVLFVASETTTFAAFIASYYYLRFVHHGPWPPPSDLLPHLFWPSVGTGILVASGLPLFLANRSAARSRNGVTGVAIALVWLMGAVFILFQFFDWQQEYPSSRLGKDAYGSLFYAIPGLHLAHVVLGLFMLLNLIARSLPISAGRPRAIPVGVVSIYWYFLIVVGVAIYLTIYLFPYSTR